MQSTCLLKSYHKIHPLAYLSSLLARGLVIPKTVAPTRQVLPAGCDDCTRCDIPIDECIKAWQEPIGE